ncbi:hypothetical protein D3C87_1478300 [compost metagenome]
MVDPARHVAVRRTVQADAEQAVDQGRAACRPGRQGGRGVGWVGRHGQQRHAGRAGLGPGPRGIGREPVGLGSQPDFDLPPRLVQPRGRNQRIAAIVAGAGQQDDAAVRHLLRQPVGGGVAGARHQREGGQGRQRGVLDLADRGYVMERRGIGAGGVERQPVVRCGRRGRRGRRGGRGGHGGHPASIGASFRRGPGRSARG